MRIGATLLVAALLVVAGCSAPNAGGGQPTATPERTTVSDGPTNDTDTTNNTSEESEALADPPSDRIGWEDGYWYNESIDVDNTDGLTDAEFQKVSARTEARIEVIRNKEFTEAVRYKQVRPEQSPGVVRPRETESFLTFEDVRYEALFLVGDQDNGRDVFWSGFSNRGAFYDYWNHSAVLLVRDADQPTLNRENFAHELAHALQDQQFNLTDYVAQPTMDGSYARRSVMEGAGKIVDREYEKRCEDGEWDCITTPDGVGVGGGIPHIGLYGQQLVWYEHGMRFLWLEYLHNGTTALDQYYRNPPNSTEQIIEESAYPDDHPVKVSLSDRASDGWERVRPDRGFPYQQRPAYARNGQSGIASMFIQTATSSFAETEYNNYSERGVVNFSKIIDPAWRTSPVSAHGNYSFGYADGWGGDRLHVYRNGSETGYVWRIVWESPEEAREFHEGYRKLLTHWGGTHLGNSTWQITDERSPYDGNAYHVTVEGDTITIVNAPSTDELGDVYGPAGD